MKIVEKVTTSRSLQISDQEIWEMVREKFGKENFPEEMPEVFRPVSENGLLFEWSETVEHTLFKSA
jgi:hypothetical protein